MPDSLRHSLTFEVYKDEFDELLGTKISITKSLSELAGKRISLNYVPATDADKTVLETYGNAGTVPAYLINLKAELKINNDIITTGPSINMGTDQILNLTFTSPKKSEMETYLMIAGDYNVVGLNIGGVKTILESRIAQSDLTDRVSEMLYQTVLSYWTEYDTLSELNARPYNVAAVRLPSEGLSSAPVTIKYVFGLPWIGYYAGRGLDVKRDVNIVLSLSGDKEVTKLFNESVGMIGSLFEGLVFDQLFKNQSGSFGLSAVKIMNLASTQGIPIFYINSNNLNSILPNLEISSDVRSDIHNAVNSGKDIVIPRASITAGGWTGTGYIVKDPITGNAGYMISGGAAGGVFMYAAEMHAAMAVDETPFSPGILNSVNEWMGLVEPSGMGLVKTRTGIDFEKIMADALRKAEEEAARQGGQKGPTSLGLLRIVALAMIIAIAIDEIAGTQVDEDYQQFRHYTKKIYKAAILSTTPKIINKSKGGDMGPCVYLTDDRVFLEPDGPSGTNTLEIQSKLFMPLENIETYIQMWIDRKRRLLRIGALENPGNPSFLYQYCYPDDLQLDPPDKGVIWIPTSDPVY